MKKTLILSVAFGIAFAAGAQLQVVKDVDHLIKANDYQKAYEAIKPALTDPETSGNYNAWFLAGKAGVGVYDEVYLKESMGQQASKDEKKLGGHGVIDAVNAFKQVLVLPDEKGKVPNKKAKESLKLLKEQYLPLRNAGVFLLNAGDYDGAYDAWELYVNYPNDPVFQGKGPQADPDTIVGQFMFYQAMAMLSKDDNQTALNKIKQVIPTGYESVDIYRYGVEAARRVNDTIAMLDLAKLGYEKYGTEDISFIGQLINGKLSSNDYAECHKLAEEAIANTPDSKADIKSQLYDILGYIYEQEDNAPLAIENFDKAIKLDNKYAKGYFDKGRVIYNTAVKEDENSDEKSQSRDVKSELLEAADLFKTAYQLDSTLTQIPNILYRLYYRLGAGYEQDAEEWHNM